jgi:hypothetical protein
MIKFGVSIAIEKPVEEVFGFVAGGECFLTEGFS